MRYANPALILHLPGILRSFVIIFLFVTGNAYCQMSSQTQTINLDAGWRFHFGHADDPVKDFNYGISNIFAKSGKASLCAIDPIFNDSAWRNLDLPHDWAVELPFVKSENADVIAHGFKPVGGLFPESSIGWYRKAFSVTPSDSGRRFFLKFDGVFRNASFWLNGFYLGTNESGYIGITFDVSDYIDFHRSNILVVRVDATQYEGWFYEGAGIYRHVWLITRDQLHIADDGIFVYSAVNENAASIYYEVEVKNDASGLTEADLLVMVTDRDGRVVSDTNKTPFEVRPHTTELLKNRLVISKPRLWSLEDPYLYRLKVLVRQMGRLADQVVTRFGIRTLAFDPATGFYLNGKNVKIKGVNCHQDHAGVGSALPDYLHYYRIQLLQKMGVNAYRASHNPPAPELLDACDSLGMLVLDEHRLLNSSPEYTDQFTRLIRRDRNHPSVFLWSIGNEEGLIQTTGTGKRIALSLIALQHQLDSTRTCTYAADLPNVFTGINEVIPIRSFNYRQFAVEEYHLSHPHQPILGTEMGSTVTTRGIYERDTVRCYLPDQDITAPWWASKAEEWWPLCASQPWWMGGFIWTGFDYRGEPTPFTWPNVNSHFGIMDMCGFPKNLYYYYKSWWSNEDVLHISPHWNWQGKVREGDSVKVWINSNADEVGLSLNGKSYGKKAMPRNGHLSWNIPFKPGKLVAMGSWNGRKISASVETTGKPVAVRLLPETALKDRSNNDVLIVNVVVLDDKGREVPDAMNRISFTLEGDGRILGVGNGDPSSQEADICHGRKCERNLFNGKCQVILKTNGSSGIIIFSAFADGLISDTYKIL